VDQPLLLTCDGWVHTLEIGGIEIGRVPLMKNILTTAALGAAFGASLILTVGSAVAQADPAPPPGRDGMVNVVVGGATYLDSVPDAQAAQAVAQLCSLPGAAIDSMVATVDTAGGAEPACAGKTGEVVLTQNLPPAMEHSPVVPGTSASWGSGEAAANPKAPDPIAGSLPTAPDNMSSEN